MEDSSRSNSSRRLSVRVSQSRSSNGSLSNLSPEEDSYASTAAATPPSKSRRRSSNTDRSRSHRAVKSFWKALRWILLGFGIGAASTALFQSVNIPTIRVELEYADAPALIETSTSVLNKADRAVQLGNVIAEVRHRQTVQDGEDTRKYRAKKVEKDTVFSTEDGGKTKLDDSDDQVDNDAEESKAEKEEDEEQVALTDDDINSQKSRPFDSKSANSQTTSRMSRTTLLQIQRLNNEPSFENVPVPPELEKDEGFAACLLIKDDNHWLIEWLAYHYHVMPLKHLIVAVDPDSKTSPINVLNRWTERDMMSINIWNDTHFMPKTIKGNLKMYDNNTELMMHRTRQNNFYFKCINTLRRRKEEWLMLIDTDEYIVTNYASGLYFNITKNIPITTPGNVLKFIKQHHDLSGVNHTCIYVSRLVRYKDIFNASVHFYITDKHCCKSPRRIILPQEPRFMFGVREQSSAELVNRHLPEGINGYDLMTQRFIYRNPRRMHNGKNLLNLKLLPALKVYTSVHHVSSFCPDPDKMRKVNHVRNSLVKIHHYLGTEEQYFFRSDPRQQHKNVTKPLQWEPSKPKRKNPAYFTRGKGRYDALNKRAIYPDQGARAWIKGFIKDVGVETAKALLQGVGQVGYE